MLWRIRWPMLLIIISANSGVFWSAAWNCFSSSESTLHSVLAMAVALRGTPAITASSPKISPAFTTPKNLLWIIRPISPSSSRYIRAPLEKNPPDFSFSLKMGFAAGFTSTVPVARKNSSASLGL